MRAIRQPSAPGLLGRVRAAVNTAARDARLGRFAAALLAIAAPPSPAQPCDPPAARVISTQGEVEASSADVWRPVRLDQTLCSGQRLRIKANSRAVLVLPNETQVHLDAGTILSLTATPPRKWLELLRGALHIITRVPRALDIRTPYANAGVEGTEFVLRVRRDETQLWVYEGRVRFDNAAGRLILTGGEAATAERGRAPQRRIVVRPRKAVEWALYYPPLIDTRPERIPAAPGRVAIRAALEDYRAGDITSALQRLQSVPAAGRNAYYLGVRAGLYLSIGRVAKAERDILTILQRNPKDATAFALRSVIAVVRNETEVALRDARAAVQAEPSSPTPYVALSYAQQAAFDIEAALASLEQASQYAPQDALVWARLSELQLSRADLHAALAAARRAERLDPRLARTQAVLGFAELTRIDIDAAQRHFEQALRLDPADPLPRLGLGLARIRVGEVDAGTQAIEIAASLDPNNSLIRSYLGKAYFEQKRGGLAATEFEQAKRLDPKDPTPWFYDAIHKQTTNRPVEALHDLQRAIDLNDNRAVYRSRLLLDEDLAARSAALGRVYGDLGFEQRALVEGWRSVNTDPGDYSGHRLLADSYSSLPRHQIARASELLQSQLLQPLNVTPVQPQLAETDLLILEGSGPMSQAFNEFNPLMLRNRLTLQGSAAYGSNDTIADEVVHAGIWNKLSYSLGQYHYDTDGYRDNNHLTDDIYNLFTQASLSPWLSVQTELRYRDTRHGDLALDFDPTLFPADFDNRRVRASTVRAGARVSPAPHSDLIASFIYGDIERGREVDRELVSFTNNRIYQGEAQYLYRAQAISTVTGGGYYHLDSETARLVTRVFHGNAYLYANVPYPRTVTWTIGVSYDSMSNGFLRDLGEINRVHPKFGVSWDLTPETRIRAAAFRVLKRRLDAEQTLEPTQIAGFNQLFDDFGGTLATRYGIGIDHAFSPALFGGAEFSRRDLDVPIRRAGIDDWDEELFRAYLYWTPHRHWAGSVRYEREIFESGGLARELGGVPPSTITETVPIGVGYFHPSGLFARLRTTYVDQKVELPTGKDGDEFTLVDAAVGYRLPNRFGVLDLAVNNVLGTDFDYQGLRLRTSRQEEENPPFTPERSVLVRVILAY